MNKRWRRKSDKRKLGKLVVFIVAVLLLGVLLPRLFALMGAVALYPIQATQGWFQNTSMVLPALWREKVELQEEIIALETKLANESDPSISLDRLSDENIQLRTLLSATTSDRIAAVVVARPDQLPYDVLQIDQGSRAGVKFGAPVYSDSEQVVGLVSEVYPSSALVTMFTTPGFSTQVYLGDSNVLVTLEGLGGGSARVLVPQGIPLQLDSLVYVPSIQPGVFGRIVHIENEPTQPQQFGYVNGRVATQHLRYVSVGMVTDVSNEIIDVEGYIKGLQSSLELPDILLATTTATSTATSTVEVEQS